MADSVKSISDLEFGSVVLFLHFDRFLKFFFFSFLVIDRFPFQGLGTGCFVFQLSSLRRVL
jgi:hypothetical protein